MGYFQVTSGELRQNAEELNELNKRFLLETENLMNCQVELKNDWTGEANDSFNREFLKDKSHLDSFHNIVGQYVQSLLTIADKYEEAENRNLSLAGSRTY